MKTLLLFLALFVTTSEAATVRLYFTDPLTNEKDTNAFYITPIGTNVLSNGGVVGRGVTTRYVPASNGYRTNTLAVGHYSITNRSLGSGVVIRVPESSSLYDYTNLLISGYNTFVTINNYTNSNSGAAVSNVFGLTFALDRRYTNSTAYYAQISSSITFTQSSSDMASFFFIIDTNVDGTADFKRTNFFHVNTGTTWSKTTFSETIPPGAAYGITNLSVGSSTFALDALSGSVIYFSTNSASGTAQTNISYAAVTNLTSFGALTNNDTRDVSFLKTLTLGSGGTDGTITLTDGDTRSYSATVGSDGWSFAETVEAPQFIGDGSLLTGISAGVSVAAGTNIVTVTNGSLVTVHGTANVTQSGLAAGSYALRHSAWLNKPSGLATNYSSLSAAKTASASGDVITATALNVGATNLLKNGVDYSFQGVTLTHSNQIPQSAGNALAPFDDRNQGALSNSVRGIKLLDYRSEVALASGAVSQTNPFVNSTAYSPIYLTNPSSVLRLEADKIQHSIIGNVNLSAGIFIKDCKYSQFKIGEIIDPYYANPSFQVGLDEFDDPVTALSMGAGIYWEHGEMHVNVDTIMGYGYGFYANYSGISKGFVENYWHTGHYIYSSGNAAIYTVGNSTDYRMWFDVDLIESDSENAITIFGTQRFYLVKNSKISTTRSGRSAISLSSSGSPEVWITSQKVASTNGSFVYMALATTGILDITAQEYIDNGTSGEAKGFWTENGTNMIHGGRAKIKNGKGIWHEGGRTFAENLYVDTATTTNTANNPVFVKAAGLMLKDCVLFAPAGAQCLAATNAQTVTILGTVICNQTNSSNITFVGGGTLITNTAMIRL